MVWLQLIYFSLLTLFFYRRDGRMNVATMLSLLYLITAVMAVGIDIFDLYGQFGVNKKVDSFWGTLIYCSGLTLVIYPFSKLRVSTTSFSLNNPKLFTITCYIMCICVLLYVTIHFSEIIYALTTDAAEVKSQHYSDLQNGPVIGGQSLIMYPINILSSTWCFLMVCWFISVIFLHKGIIFNTLLILCSLSGILKGSLEAGRAAIIYWLFSFCCFCCLFWPYIATPKLRRRIVLSVSIPIGLILLIFVSVTISRFALGEHNGAWYSFVGYAGQQYNNFCAVFEYGRDLPFTIERIMPLTYKYAFGGNFDLMEYYENISVKTGITVNNFYTLLGGLYLTTGIPFTILCISIYNIFAMKICQKVSFTFNFSYLILLSIIILVPVKGMFDVPFPYVGDTLVNFLLIGLFLLFKHSLNFNNK